MSHHLLRLRSTLQSSVLILLSAALVPTAAAREITFSGRTWDVKSGDGRGPGPNDWSDAPESVSVDDAGDLHLKIRSVNGRWLTSEITSQDTVGYGRYAFRLQSDPETYDPNVVVGLFVYENDEQEIDIEFSRWGDPQAPTYAQYATQPYATPGNLHTFDMELDGDYSTHLIDWTPERLTFTSIHGHHRSSPPGGLIEQWVYAGDDIPVPSGERLHVNFWLFRGAAPVDGLEHELVVDRLDRVAAFCRDELGRPTIAWTDGVSAGLPRDQIVNAWFSGESAKAARLGFDTINSNHEWTYLDYPDSIDNGRGKPDWMIVLPLEKIYHFDPLPDGLEAEYADRVLGSEAALWTEHTPGPDAMEKQLMPRLAAFAEVLWSPRLGRSYDDFLARLGVLRASLAVRTGSQAALPRTPPPVATAAR